MSDKNQKDAALDSTNTEGVIEYTPEQVEEHDQREKRAEQINKKLPKPDADVVGLPEAEEKSGKKKH